MPTSFNYAVSLDRWTTVGKHEEFRVVVRAGEGEHVVCRRYSAFAALHKQSLNNLGVCLRKAGETDQAEAFLRQALTAKEKVLGLSHAQTLETIAELALLLAQQGRAAEAAAVYADALQGEPLGPQAPETVEAIDALSQLLRDGGDAATAAALRERFGCK